MQLVVTREAERDVEQIADFIDAEGPAAATAFLDDLPTALTRLAEHPDPYPVVPR